MIKIITRINFEEEMETAWTGDTQTHNLQGMQDYP